MAGSSSPHVVPVPGSDPRAVDPEESFVASLSSCHMLWFLSIAATMGVALSEADIRKTTEIVRQLSEEAKGRNDA